MDASLLLLGSIAAPIGTNDDVGHDPKYHSWLKLVKETFGSGEVQRQEPALSTRHHDCQREHCRTTQAIGIALTIVAGAVGVCLVCLCFVLCFKIVEFKSRRYRRREAREYGVARAEYGRVQTDEPR